MRETRHDTTVAVALALLLHLLPALLLLLVSLLPARPPAAAGEPVHADVIDPNALSAATRAALRTRPQPDHAQPIEPPAETPPEPLPDAHSTFIRALNSSSPVLVRLISIVAV